MASRRGSGAVRGVSDLSLGAVKASNLGVLALAKLVCCEALDKAHWAATPRTFPQDLGSRRRSRRDGCSEPDNAARVPVRRMVSSHKPPNPRGIARAEKQRMPSPALVGGRAQRTQACPGGKRVSVRPRIFRETRGSKP